MAHKQIRAILLKKATNNSFLNKQLVKIVAPRLSLVLFILLGSFIRGELAVITAFIFYGGSTAVFGWRRQYGEKQPLAAVAFFLGIILLSLGIYLGLTYIFPGVFP
jgi:hypothetical protein